MNPGQDKHLEATNKTREIVPLQYLKSNKAMLIMGMYPATYGNKKDQVKHMHKKSTAWATSIRVGGVQQKKERKALNSTTPQTMKYPLSAMKLNKRECIHIMQHIVKFGPTKAGISSTLNIAVRYGPWSLGGVGIFTTL